MDPITAMWGVKRARTDRHHSILLLSFADASRALTAGEPTWGLKRPDSLSVFPSSFERSLRQRPVESTDPKQINEMR